ncbi:hypothetical protein PAXRUDRAFT_828306 [Paxillus rubicundulus Ve08.2h10]|uniref:Uncharacterized protein n=1 Tax=Paxillus rubicundulus Ve08.2h10 TaxID=930991 RepID=A0A0D0E1G1_9AGAM|nr:hypothetical protein PAXRUDRAFT_828306 [Paxillus rubicundulus Ve08.2h10]
MYELNKPFATVHSSTSHYLHSLSLICDGPRVIRASQYPVKKRKQGFWAHIFGRSSVEEEANNGQPPKRKPLINSILTTLRGLRYEACPQIFQIFLPRRIVLGASEGTSDMLGKRKVPKHTIYSKISVIFAVQVKHMLGHNSASY